MGICGVYNINIIDRYLEYRENIFLTIFITFGYFLFGKLSFSILQEHTIVTIVIFASEGLALASAIFFGKKVWLGVFLGQFILAYSSSLSFFPSCFISIINSLEAVIGVIIFNRYNLNKNLSTLRDVVGLVMIIVFILQPFSSILGNYILYISNELKDISYLSSLFSWWFGNIMGQLLFTPFILIILINYKKINIYDYLLYILLFTLFIYILELKIIVENLSLLLTFTIPAVILIISKRGLLYGVALPVVIAMVSTYSVYIGVGAFSIHSMVDNIININFFILVHISLALISGVLFEENKTREKYLEDTIKHEVAKNREQQLLMLQQSRLAQMGEMISMIAHQWRQPLNNLSLISQTIILKYKRGKLDDKMIEYFEKSSQKQIKYMSDTIDEFRNFFKPEVDKRIFNLQDSLNNAISIVSPMLKKNSIKLEISECDSCFVNGYPNKLGQSIINIINNAKDALVENRVENPLINIYYKKSEKHIKIYIKDNAGGIPDDIIERVFEPYFSTKSDKNGTGIGLYMTKIIIEEHMKGSITLSSKDGVTIFEIFLNRSL